MNCFISTKVFTSECWHKKWNEWPHEVKKKWVTGSQNFFSNAYIQRKNFSQPFFFKFLDFRDNSLLSFSCLALPSSNKVFCLIHSLIRDTVDLFGLTLDNSQNFGKHITKISKKVGKQLDVLCRLKIILSFPPKLCLYNSFIMSHFHYCSSIWHICFKSDGKKKTG